MDAAGRKKKKGITSRIAIYPSIFVLVRGKVAGALAGFGFAPKALLWGSRVASPDKNSLDFEKKKKKTNKKTKHKFCYKVGTHGELLQLCPTS